MSQIDNIVTVVIDVQSESVTQTSFGIPLIAGSFLAAKTTVPFTRARAYGSITEMTDDGWTTSDEVYKAARAIFQQNPRPTTIVVGRRDAADADWGAALAAIQAEDDSWYFVSIVPVASADTEALQVAAWTETQTKIFFSQSGDTDIITSATDDQGSVLKGLGYNRTVTLYRPTSKASEYAEAGWAGEGAPFAPGSSTWAYKDIVGATPDKLTTAQKNAAHGKNVNTFTTVAGADITEKGKVASGEWIDVIIGLDWLKARLQETIYGALVAQRKISYDDAGITAVAGLVQAVLEEAGRKGILQLDSIVLTVPKYADISSADKTARKLPDVKFTALLQGAIHLVEINGTVSV